jgi:hypothetical protein
MSVRRKAASKKAVRTEQECLCMGVGPEIARMIEGWGADGAMGHFRSARVEVLRGLRTLIDHRIETLSKRPRRGTSIEVE